jgi:hypothetical protein
MDVTGQSKNDKNDEAAAETQINLVSPFAHPRGAKVTNFGLRHFVTKHPIPVAISCLALGGMLAAVISKRRRRDRWNTRIDHHRQSLVDAANGAG